MASTTLLTPIAGFTVKTYKNAAAAYERGGKVFVNICGSDIVERAQGTTGIKIDDDHLDNRGLSNLQIPLLVGPARAMEDSSGNPAIAVDVVYHPSLVSRALNGTPQHPAKHFIGYLVDLALKNVEEDMGVKIEKELSKVKILPNCRYKGPAGQNSNNTFGFEVVNREQPPEPPRDPSKPKIEVIGEMPAKPKAKKPVKPIIRKGFFDKPNALEDDKELYPEGSAEGIPEPGRGNSVNMLPDNIKNKCHIVDTGAMDSNSLMETMKQYADTGRINPTQKGVYAKGEGPKADKPEIGIGHPEFYKKKAEEDKKWNPEKKTKEEPAAPAVSESLFKFVGQQEEPKYRIDDTVAKGAEALAIVVELPKIERMSQLHLDMVETQLQVRGGPYRLKVALPKKINVEGVTAKFISKKKELKVVAPIEY
mmetsp:Transcript_38445/g.83653  ORF Transcript_38445/g.83653 Transcript_38445/m.83653 type:complete len:422 (-) Transcript_38445:265-1530(-)